MTLLSIVQTAVEEIGELDPISYVAGNTGNDAVRQLFAFANKVGREAARQFSWRELLKEHTFTTTTATAYDLPSDYFKMADGSAWDTTTKRRMIGNTNPLRWRAMNGLSVTTQLNFYYRLRGTQFTLYPAPTAGLDMAFDYQSTQWCTSASGTPQTAFAADTDVSLLPEDLLALGVRHYFMAANGMDSAGAMEEYQRAYLLYRNANIPGGVLDMGESVHQPHAGYQGNVPDVIDA
jgi:hypothetical protein